MKAIRKTFWPIIITFLGYASSVLRRNGIKNDPGYYPFQDPSLDWDVRVDDLVTRFKLEEIPPQTFVEYGKVTPAIERLGLLAYNWDTECLRGMRRTNSTSFPQALGLAAAFSKSLIFNVSEAVSFEARAFYNEFARKGKDVSNYGLSCYSPVINIMRHPLWGRNQETYGEDPLLSGTYAKNYVKGLQGPHPRYVRANAGCKHFDVHGGPENIPSSRFSFNSKVSIRDWRMTFLPQFKMCVNAGTYSLMCSYNSINGVPSCANWELLTNITRNEWGFKGFVVSDDMAIINIMKEHKYTKTKEQTVAAAIKAGCNMELGHANVFSNQIKAMNDGLLEKQQLYDNIKPIMYTRMRLGEFDPDGMNPYNDIDFRVVQSRQHRELALKAAKMSFVLLKNEKNALPLQTKYKRLAIVGPFANSSEDLMGDYSSDPDPKFIKTPFQGIDGKISQQTVLESGCSNPMCSDYNSTALKDAVVSSDLVIVCLGLGTSLEMEGNDRSDIDLPGKQLDLLKEASYYANGSPVIVLVFTAGPVDLTWAKLSDSVSAIISCTYPSQATGEALYNTLVMSDPSSVPAGRLPATWPAYLNQVPPMTDYTMEGRTYRYYKGSPLYPFGYGLSYTIFHYSNLQLSSQYVNAGQDMKGTVQVSNHGLYDADEVIQIYISWPEATVPVPKWQLVEFDRIAVQNEKTVTYSFTITSERMAVWGEESFIIEPGNVIVYAGGQQPNQDTKVPSNVLKSSFTIQGTKRL